MSRGEIIEETSPVTPRRVPSQQAESESASNNSSCFEHVNRTRSSANESVTINAIDSVGDMAQNSASRVYTSELMQSLTRTGRDSSQMMQRTHENETGNNRIPDSLRTSFKSQSVQSGEWPKEQPGGSFSGHDIRRDRVEPVLTGDRVSLVLFKKVCKEAALLRKQLSVLKQEQERKPSAAQLEREKHALEDENFRLKEELKQTRSMLSLDENGRPMGLTQDILKENERLQNRVSFLENSLKEVGSRLSANKKMYHTVPVDEMSDASQNDLQKHLKAEKDKNRKLEEECNLLKLQIETYAEDFHAEKKEQGKKESQLDIKFTIMRGKNEKLEREVKKKDKEIMRLRQYQKEFESS